MPFHSPTDPTFWDLEPDFLKPVQAAARAFDMDIVHFILGPHDDERSPVAAVLRIPPNGVLVRHAHPVARFEVVVQGAIDVGDRVLVPGDIMVSPANEFYGPHTAGDEGCTTVEVFASLAGVGNIIYDTEDGPQPQRFR